MKTLLIDLDDVITTGNFTRLIENYLNRSIDPSEIKGYYIQEVLEDKRDDFFDNYFFEQDLYKDAILIEGAYEVIKKLNEKYELYICSDYVIVDRPRKSGIHLKNKFNFLLRTFDYLKVNQFIFSCNKSLIHTDIKIDDKVNHLVNADTKLLFSAYHNTKISDDELNEKDITRVNNWNEISELLLGDE